MSPLLFFFEYWKNCGFLLFGLIKATLQLIDFTFTLYMVHANNSN